MSHREDTRRNFLKDAGLAAGALLAGVAASRGAEGERPAVHLATNQYPWICFYRREGRSFAPDEGLKEIAAAGLHGFEPIVTAPQQIDQLAPLLEKHGLEMRSLYVNCLLHEPEQVKPSTENVLAIAEKARRLGTKFIVANPTPIRWGGPENKNDAQLRLQGQALDRLGAELKQSGMTLAYHNHDIEMRNAAREFHHMMVGTDPEHVSLCLDAHWIYRGSGDSAVALFDVIELYGRRVVELHVRQSIDGVWTEAVGEGDVDYPAIAEHLLGLGVKPHVVLEQAVEQGSPRTMDAVEAHRRSCEYAGRVFAAFSLASCPAAG